MTLQSYYLSVTLVVATAITLTYIYKTWSTTRSFSQSLKAFILLPVSIGVLLLLPLMLIQNFLHDNMITPSMNVWSCILSDRTSLCYVSAALKDVSITKSGEYRYHNAFAICQLAKKPENCMNAVCSSLQSGRSKKEVATNQKICREKIVPPCKNGSITDQVPCGCEVKGRGYTAYTQKWYDTYWNVYRKLDKPPYCCNGKTSQFFCS